jgi:hypothetical protein
MKARLRRASSAASRTGELPPGLTAGASASPREEKRLPRRKFNGLVNV